MKNQTKKNACSQTPCMLDRNILMTQSRLWEHSEHLGAKCVVVHECLLVLSAQPQYFTTAECKLKAN